MIAVDTNILVYCHREDSQWHEKAREAIRSLAEGTVRWSVPWPCIHELIAIATHPRIYSPPTPVDCAFQFIESVCASPSLSLIGEGPTHIPSLRELCVTGKVNGAMVHDARIAAICIQHRVSELWSADRDFSRFAGIRVRNPLVGKSAQ